MSPLAVLLEVVNGANPALPHPNPGVDLLRLLGVVLFAALNGAFVGTEFSLITVRWTRVEELVEQKKWGAQALRHLHENLTRSLAGTQLGITIMSLTLGWLGEPAVAHLLEPLFHLLAAFRSKFRQRAFLILRRHLQEALHGGRRQWDHLLLLRL